MALTEAQVITVSQILGQTPVYVQGQIDFLGSVFTTAKQTAVIAQITLWDAGAGVATTKIHPKESNRGVETNPTKKRADIRNNIAVLLERPDWAGNSAGTRLQRG